MATKKKAKSTRGAGAAKKGSPKRAAKGATKEKTRAAVKASADQPQLFRINIEVADLDAADRFYTTLLGQSGRRQAGSRVYFTVNDLDAIFERARSLDCLSKDRVHGMVGGEIAVRPWGERSFYADDPWQNPLCFVEAGTVYPG